MFYGNVELHNIEEVHPVDGRQGVRMQRVPENVRVELNDGAREKMLQPAGAEVRLVAEGGEARITLSCPNESAKAVVFHGVFQDPEIRTVSSEPTTIRLSTPERPAKLDKETWGPMPFSPRVFRIMLRGGSVHFHGAEGVGIRPPGPDEVPGIRYLAYGTSITHGASATAPHLCYAQQTARRIGADLLNLGSGGSAHCEHAISDYIGERKDWHIATLALSVNMRGFTLDEFHERVSYMVDTVAGADVARPVVCITLYPFFDDLGEQLINGTAKGTAEEYRQKLRDAVSSCPHANVYLVEGPEILEDIGGLTPDLLHPADNGMIRMGENLAERLKPLCGNLESL